MDKPDPNALRELGAPQLGRQAGPGRTLQTAQLITALDALQYQVNGLVGNGRDTNQTEGAALTSLIQKLTQVGGNHQNAAINNSFHSTVLPAIPRSSPPRLADLQALQAALNTFKNVVDSQ